MNVLSLFDGISCGYMALLKSDIPITKYFSSEIDKHAMKVSSYNFPNIIQLGDVRDVNEVHNIDLLIGGSPCRGFSCSGKGLNFNDPESRLFFEYVRVLKLTKPKYFLLENVVMKKEHEDIISEYLGVKPIKINSSLVSAQNRVRLYWTNIPYTEIEDRNIQLQDILDTTEYTNPAAIRGRTSNGKRTQCLEVKSKNTNKSNCLTTVDKDNVLTSLPSGRYKDVYNSNYPYRNYSLSECCRLQTVDVDYFKGLVSDSKGKQLLGRGWTVDVISHLFNGIKL